MVNQTGHSQTVLLEQLLTDREFAIKSGHHEMHARMLQFLGEGTGERVLELGCGPGKYVAMLYNAGFEVTGVDPIEFPTWDKLRERSIDLRSGIHAESLPFDDDSFDAVVCVSALLYFVDPKRAMGEIRRVLRPGGKLVFRNVNADNLYTRRTGKPLDPASRNLYSMAQLQQLLRDSGFEVAHSFAFGFWPPFLPDFWWYVSCVWINNQVQKMLSRLLPEAKRINLILWAIKP